MPGLDLCAARLCRKRTALLFEKGHQAAAPQGGIYLGRGEVTRVGRTGCRVGKGAVAPCPPFFKLIAGPPRRVGTLTLCPPYDFENALMHRGEESRHPEAGQPGPYRLAADAEVPRPDYG